MRGPPPAGRAGGLGGLTRLSCVVMGRASRVGAVLEFFLMANVAWSILRGRPWSAARAASGTWRCLAALRCRCALAVNALVDQESWIRTWIRTQTAFNFGVRLHLSTGRAKSPIWKMQSDTKNIHVLLRGLPRCTHPTNDGRHLNPGAVARDGSARARQCRTRATPLLPQKNRGEDH